MNSSVTKTYRADWPVWILAHIIPGILWLGVWINWYGGHGMKISDVLVSSVAEVFALAWLISFRIVITPSELIFRSLFRGRHTIRHNEIKKIRLAWKFRRTAGGPLILIVEPKENHEKGELIINAKVLSKQAVDAVLDLGKRVAESDDGGLRDGIVWKTIRNRKKGEGQ